jgi:hypothetical protein
MSLGQSKGALGVSSTYTDRRDGKFTLVPPKGDGSESEPLEPAQRCAVFLFLSTILPLKIPEACARDSAQSEVLWLCDHQVAGWMTAFSQLAHSFSSKV